jgi:putative PIN family toxin of toxin-antitoxin system
MKVVIDTNVVVGGHQKQRPGSRPSCSGRAPRWEWVVSTEILTEYREVLACPKFGLSPTLLREWITFLEMATVLVEVPAGLAYPPDPTDAKFLACALAVKADWLVTGDRDFTQARKFLTTTILSVSQFKTHVCDSAS